MMKARWNPYGSLGRVAYRITYLFSVLLCGLLTGCAPFLVGPTDPNSSLVIGRVVIDNKYSGHFYGVLPLGLIEKGLEVEVESRDGKQIFNITTGEQGYFLVPNVPPNTYYVRRVTFEGESGRARERRGQEVRRLNFTPVPGKVLYIGTLVIDLSERGFSTYRELREDERAKGHFVQTYGSSPWVLREFIAAGPKPVLTTEQRPVEAKPTVRLASKADRPQWKVGYQWTYAWKRAGTNGTITREIIREDSFEGVPSYVVRVGKNENFYAKEVLGGGFNRGDIVMSRKHNKICKVWGYRKDGRIHVYWDEKAELLPEPVPEDDLVLVTSAEQMKEGDKKTEKNKPPQGWNEGASLRDGMKVAATSPPDLTSSWKKGELAMCRGKVVEIDDPALRANAYWVRDGASVFLAQTDEIKPLENGPKEQK